jgi:phage terminase large subunit GpA-like protein
LDTGFATQEAYAFVRNLRDSACDGRQGVARGAALIGTPTAIDVSQGGKKLRRGIKVFTVAVSIAKLEFYNNLRKSADVARTASPRCSPPGSSICPRSMPSSSSNSARSS